MTTLGLIRHGLTDWNRAGRMQGQTDIPLNEEGKLQAKLLAARLGKEDTQWHAVYSSDLGRASTTAQFICDELGLQSVVLDPRLRERTFGLAEGLTVAEREERFGDDLATRAGIESEEEVLDRGRRFLKELMDREKGNHVLIVSHGGFLRKFFSLLIPDIPDVYIDNASITIVRETNGAWELQLHNCTVHYAESRGTLE